MRRTIKISALILLYFLACGKSCDNQERYQAEKERKSIKTATDSLHAEFGSDTLSVSALHAYEESAKMKFSDFLDYLRILHDTTAAEPFRVKAREMIGKIFIGGIGEPAGYSTVNPGSVIVTEPARQVSPSTCKGKLGFTMTQQEHGKGAKSDPTIKPTSGSIGFLIIKHDKKFGPDAVSVWEVFLGDPDSVFLK
ncbi:MAG: hypothetical protein ACOYNC_14780 [Bacteroidales bacterium]